MRPPVVVILAILLGGTSLLATMLFALSEAQITSNDLDAIRDIFLFLVLAGLYTRPRFAIRLQWNDVYRVP